MHKVYKTAIINYSQRLMFDLVNDIDSYPQFLSWCDNSKITHINDNQLYAFIEFNKGPFKQKFSTKNTLYPHQKMIMSLVKGPFKVLNGNWEFIKLSENSTKIVFNLEFSFQSKILDLALAPTFSNIAGNQLNAFVVRAKQIYG